MYSPKISEKHVHPLWLLGQKLAKPMTTLADEAISDFIEKHAHLLHEPQETPRGRTHRVP